MVAMVVVNIIYCVVNVQVPVPEQEVVTSTYIVAFEDVKTHGRNIWIRNTKRCQITTFVFL